MEAAGTTSIAGKRKPRGRVGKDKQEQAERPQVVQERIDELVALKKKAELSAQSFSDAVKEAAQDSGLLASVVRRFVVARAGESYEEKKRENVQLALLFDEVGVIPRPSTKQ